MSESGNIRKCENFNLGRVLLGASIFFFIICFFYARNINNVRCLYSPPIFPSKKNKLKAVSQFVYILIQNVEDSRDISKPPFQIAFPWLLRELSNMSYNFHDNINETY